MQCQKKFYSVSRLRKKTSPLNIKSAIVCRLMNIPSAEAAASSPIFPFWFGPGIDPNLFCCHYLRSCPCPKGNHVVTIPDVIEGTRGMQTPANRSLITHSERINVVLNDKRQLRPCQDGVNCRRAKRLTCDSQSRHPGRHRTSQTMQIHHIKPYCQPED